MVTTIRIEKEIREALRVIGRKNQTYNDIIKEMVKERKKRSTNSAKLTESQVS